jgi:DNA-directed RNA polymerase II subunit RPB2
VILPEEDMPFDENGLRPDIIINPHAIPSRMTIGQLKETLLGLVLLELGLFGDGTSFNDLPISEICKLLTKNGYESHGEKLFMNGQTGEQLETNVFVGPAFYQRLKHMVNDKQHARATGPMVVLTRQPAEGRAREGGLRYGEMERDCMVSHGCSRFTKGRLYDSSDKFSVHACKQCGLFVVFNDAKNIHHCRTCGNRTAFSKINIPYAFKLLTQELITMNIAPRVITE